MTSFNKDVFDSSWEAVRAAYGLSPIVLVEEKEYSKDNKTGEMKAINGWDDNIVVLRPVGDAVTFFAVVSVHAVAPAFTKFSAGMSALWTGANTPWPFL